MRASVLRSASSLALASFFLLAGTQASADPGATKVTKLRTEKITFYDENGNKSGDFERSNFNQPWPIKGESKNGLLPVIVDGQQRWVRAFAVETDQQVQANQDCGIVVTGREPKAGVTRGLGEGCPKEPKK